MKTMIRKRSWPTVSAGSFANGRRTRGAGRARSLCTTPNGIPRPILEIRGTTSRTRRPLSAKTALEASDLVQGYSFWTFSDIFEENYFPSVPFHGGFGLLTLHGIAKPTYRAFELLHKLGTRTSVG